MPKNLRSERKYIIESKVDEWDGKAIKWMVRKYWTFIVNRMPEGEVLKTAREIEEENRPLAWLNGGESNGK